jgi:hypothetical protein
MYRKMGLRLEQIDAAALILFLRSGSRIHRNEP